VLKLKPTCENCDKELPADSTEARICSYECTFCADCVDGILRNVCPNCGGGFCQRPSRPATAWVPNVCLQRQPAVTEKTFKPVDAQAHAKFSEKIASIPAHER